MQRPGTPTCGKPKLLVDCQTRVFAEMKTELMTQVDFRCLRGHLHDDDDDVTDDDDNGQLFREIERRVEDGSDRDVIALLLVSLRRRHPDLVREFDRRVFELMRSLSNHVVNRLSATTTATSSGRSSPYGGRRIGGPHEAGGQPHQKSWVSSKSAYYTKARFSPSPSPQQNEIEEKRTTTKYKVDNQQQQQQEKLQQQLYEDKQQQKRQQEKLQQKLHEAHQKQKEQEENLYKEEQQQLQAQHEVLQQKLHQEQQKQKEQEEKQRQEEKQQIYKQQQEKEEYEKNKRQQILLQRLEQQEKQRQEEKQRHEVESLYDKVQKQLQYNDEQQKQKQQLEEEEQKQQEKLKELEAKLQQELEEQRQEEERQRHQIEQHQQLEITEIEKDARLSEAQEATEINKKPTKNKKNNEEEDDLGEMVPRRKIRKKSRKRSSLSKIRRRLLPSLSEDQELEIRHEAGSRSEKSERKKSPEPKLPTTTKPKVDDNDHLVAYTEAERERRATLDDVIVAVSEKFAKLASKAVKKENFDAKLNKKQQNTKTIAQHFHQQLDQKLFVDELVRTCVVSVRSAWLLRHAKGGAFVRMLALARLLASLALPDRCDVITKCDNTSGFVRCLCKCKKERKHANQLFELFRDQQPTTTTTQQRHLPEATNYNKPQTENLRSKQQQQQKTNRKTIDKPIRRSKLPQNCTTSPLPIMTSSPIADARDDDDVTTIRSPILPVLMTSLSPIVTPSPTQRVDVTIRLNPPVKVTSPRNDDVTMKAAISMTTKSAMTSSSTCDLHGGQSEQQQQQQEEMEKCCRQPEKGCRKTIWFRWLTGVGTTN